MEREADQDPVEGTSGTDADVLAFLGDDTPVSEPAERWLPAPEAPPAPPPDTDVVVAYNADLLPSAAARSGGGGRPRKAIAGALSLVLVLGAAGYVLLGPSTPSAEASHLRRSFTAKEKHTYDFEMSMRGSAEMPGAPTLPMNMSMNMRLTERTVKVAKDGTAVVRASVDRMRATVDGESVAFPVRGLTLTTRVAPDGTVLDVEGLDGFGLGQAGPATDLIGPEWMGPLLPSNAVAPGDTWTVTQQMPMPGGAGDVQMTARNKLISVRSSGKHETAVIGSQISIPMKMTLSMDDLMDAARASGQAFPTDGLPSGMRFIYDGSLTMDLVQTVVRATSRPLSVTGTGRMDFTMVMQGMPGGDQRMSMGIDLDVAMNEV